MIGFIKGLLGSKQPSEPAPAQQPQVPVVVKKPAAFFLEADDAQTLGNIEYMRTTKAVKRTFPKTVNNEEMKTILEISSVQRAQLAKQQAQLANTLPIVEVTEAVAAKVDETAKRRRTDTSMDMFRSMAKDLKKP